MTIRNDKDKPFAGERFMFADSKCLGPAPWDTQPQTPTLKVGCGPASRKVRRCPTSIKVWALEIRVFTYLKSGQVPTERGFQLMLLSLLVGLTSLAWNAALPLSGLHHTLLSQTCPISILGFVKPYNLMGHWRQTPCSFNRNYAAYGEGARVLRRFTSQTHGLPPPSILGSLAESLFGYNPQYANVNGAGIILEESVDVGECWRISGGASWARRNQSIRAGDHFSYRDGPRISQLTL